MHSLADVVCAEGFSLGQTRAFFKNLGTGPSKTLLLESKKYGADDISDISEPADFTVQQFVDLVRFIGGAEVARRVLQGTITAEADNSRIMLVNKESTLFDHRGRRIPLGLQSSVCDPFQEHWVELPHATNWPEYCINLACFNGISTHSPKMTEFAHKVKSQAEFLEIQLKRNNTENILKGVHFPIMVPQLTEDYTQTLFGHYLDTVKYICCKLNLPRFEDFSHQPTQKGVQMSVAPGSGQDQFLWKLRNSSVTALYFPNALLGFSRKASWEQMRSLPQGFCVAGGLETFIAVGYSFRSRKTNAVVIPVLLFPSING